jgi:uncharacterized protein (DUF433 family)
MLTAASSLAGSVLSTKEAAVLSNVKEKRVRRLVRELHVGRRAKGTNRNLFSSSDVLFLSLTRELPVSLDRKTTRDLYELLSKGLQEKGRWRTRNERLFLGEMVIIDFRKVHGEVAKRLSTYKSGAARITSDPDTMGGESVFKGTRISVAHVGALATRGVPLEEILEDYPRLRERDVALAALLHRMGRRPGRPRKALTLHR